MAFSFFLLTFKIVIIIYMCITSLHLCYTFLCLCYKNAALCFSLSDLCDLFQVYYARINVKPEGGGGGDPGQMWGIWLFRRIFGQNPHYGTPKFGQIRLNIPRCSINLYWK